MARRRFEMHHYRQALLRMRQGDSDRDIAAARVMGRPKAAHWRRLATEAGWLDPAQPLPDDEAIAAALGAPRKASTTISTLEPHRHRLSEWIEQGVSGTATNAHLPLLAFFRSRSRPCARRTTRGRPPRTSPGAATRRPPASCPRRPRPAPAAPPCAAGWGRSPLPGAAAPRRPCGARWPASCPGSCRMTACCAGRRSGSRTASRARRASRRARGRAHRRR